jgi:transcriptional regulator with XRE-family HTH domain
MTDERGFVVTTPVGDSTATLDAGAQLVTEMRRIREASGLSFGGLASRTHYSRSSWERFLNGKQIPSRVAVVELARVIGDDPGPLLELWDRVVGTDEQACPDEAEQPSGQGQPGAGAKSGAGAESPGPTAGTGLGGAGAVPALKPARTSVSSVLRAPSAAVPSTAGASTAVRPAAAASAEESEVSEQPADGTVLRLGGSTVKSGRRQRTWRRRLLVVGCVVLGAVAGSIGTELVHAGLHRSGSAPKPAPTGSALSAPVGMHASCAGDTCLGREPQAENCEWDATTVRQTWLRGLQIELRYSAACQAVWGRIENGTIGDGVSIADSWSRTQDASVRTGTDTYTRMLSTAGAPASTVTICGLIPSQHEKECSPDLPSQP